MNTERNIISIDTETYYSKTYTIKDLGNYGYCQHEEFNPYLLTAAVDDGEWVGHPTEFGWEEANDQIWIMANAGFDTAVIRRLAELGKIPKVTPFAIYDVLDLARYLGCPGNLAGACEHMLGVKLDKSTRNTACGKQWEAFTPEFQDEMRRYAVRDARYTLQIFQKYNQLWPEWERELSRITREMCDQGVPMDMERIDSYIETLEVLLWKARTKIPWTVEGGEAGPLSRKAFSMECRKCGVTPPKSMAKDSAEFEEWLRKHGDQFQWAKAIGSYRSLNGQLVKLRSMKARCTPEGNMVYGLKYAGAHTLRDSGDAGVNVQNFPKNVMFEAEMREHLGKVGAPDSEKYGLDIRGCIMAPDCFTLGIVDLAAIEPCVLAFCAKDWDLLDLIGSGMDVYESWARIHHNYTDSRPLKEADAKLRQLCKVEVLGLGYGAGPDKLVVIAKMLAGLTLSTSEATEIVAGFRRTGFVPRLWQSLEAQVKSAAGGDATIRLPSGRSILYRDVRNLGSISAVIPRTGVMMRVKLWGGTLAENLVQAISRDIFMDRVLELYRQELRPIMRVHDEAVTLLPVKTAETQLRQMITIMSTAPTWGEDIPVRADGKLSKRYEK